MKEAVMVSHNQDMISAIPKIGGLSKFFVSYGCMRFATLIRISCVAAIRLLVCVKSLCEFEWPIQRSKIFVLEPTQSNAFNPHIERDMFVSLIRTYIFLLFNLIFV